MKTTIYVLFQTDVWKTYKSRVFCGVFSTKVKAIDAAKANDLYRSDAVIQIVECELDKFDKL